MKCINCKWTGCSTWVCTHFTHCWELPALFLLVCLKCPRYKLAQMVDDKDICDVPEKGSQEAVPFGTRQGVIHGIGAAPTSLSHIRSTSATECFPHASLPTAGRQVMSKQIWQISQRWENISIFTFIVLKFQGLKVSQLSRWLEERPSNPYSLHPLAKRWSSNTLKDLC